MAKKKGDITALYERLSRDDEKYGDSISIVNQKKMLESFAKENGFVNFQHYTDDGYSGGSFDRPGWNRLIADIENGKISTVITKDMSRIGRNYLLVGYYTETYFNQKNIRFIAVSNNIDSENQESSEFVPFLNVFNEWYLRDCSRKIKAAKRSLGNSGVHLASTPCYGYIKDPKDKNKWIIDEEAAEVIRTVYKLCIEGNGPWNIANLLRAYKIETPAYHMAKKGIGRYKSMLSELDPYNWNGSTVRIILSRPEYLGYTVNFRTSSKSYKEHKNIINSTDKWAVFKGTQEPIVDLYVYQLAQKLLGTSRRRDTIGEANPLTGIVFCADCGAKMYNHRSKEYMTRYGKKKHGFDGYDCSAYKLASRKTKSPVCSSHYISTKALRSIILHTIQNVCRYALDDREAFINKVKELINIRNENTTMEAKKKYNADRKRFQELDILFQKIYESFVSGIISEDKFRMLSSAYEEEQKKLQFDINAYEISLNKQQEADDDIDKFYALIDKYTSLEELTPSILNEFIDKVLVHKAQKIDGNRVQKVEVYLNFIGKIDFPILEEAHDDPEQEKIDKYWKERYRRSKERERGYRKKKQEEIGKIIEADKTAKRNKIIKELNREIDIYGVENLSVLPARLRNGASNV